MNSIDPTTALAAALRAQFARLHARGPDGTPAKLARPVASPAQNRYPQTSKDGRATTEGGKEDLATNVAKRVGAIDPSDPDRRRKAFTAFLESLLLDEWGAQLINDPAFHQLVADVQGQMTTDPSQQPLIDRATDLLLATPQR